MLALTFVSLGCCDVNVFQLILYSSTIHLAWTTPVLERGLAADDRLKALVATVSDRPGGIARLTTLLGNNGASIKDIYHERAFLHANIDHVRVKVVIELQGKDHAQKIQEVLIADGYNPVWDDDTHKKMI